MKTLSLIIILNVFVFRELLSQMNNYHCTTYYNSNIKVNQENIPVNKDQLYSPQEMFPNIHLTPKDTEELSDELKTNFDIVPYYSWYLFIMKEPLLFNRKSSKQIFRFTYLMTFQKPIVLRIEKDKNCNLFYKYLDGLVGYTRKDSLFSQSQIIDLKSWNSLSEMINKQDFWSLKPNVEQNIMVDGGYLIVEGTDSTRYQVISSFSSSASNGFLFDWFYYLLKMTNIKLHEQQ